MSISEQFDVLYHAIKCQSQDVQDELLPPLKGLRLAHLALGHKTNKAAKSILTILQDCELEIKSLQFDLDVTRKERDANS